MEKGGKNTEVQKVKHTKLIGEILMEQGVITSTQLEEALEEQKSSRRPIGEILRERGWANEEQVNRALAIQLGIPEIDLSSCIIEPEVSRIIPQELARKYKLIPVYKSNEILTVAMAEPTNLFIIEELRKETGCVIEPNYASEMDILRAIDMYYGVGVSIRDIIKEAEAKKLSSEEMEKQGIVVRVVNAIIVQAVKQRASDIHIEPEEKELGIRYRIDGIMQRIASLPKTFQAPVVSRIKIMADLDIAERRVPQDGRIMMRISNKELDFRVSTQPTIYGENVVMRILDRSSLRMDLEDLGFDEVELNKFREMIKRPYGIILVTGPTGSGKSTTLYAVLQRLNKEDVNIMTVEDPVEYNLALVRQTQINPKAGLTYAKGLRAILRQDPDIVMVGEIRDLETAQIAIRASLTGHLVLSTLHTNNAPAAFTRLVDMGLEPFLVSSSVIGVLAQRLVRRICENCKEEIKPEEELIQQLNLIQEVKQGIKFYRGKGCPLCNNTGYKGRVAIFELLQTSREIQKLVIAKASVEEIEELGKSQGMRTLREAAIRKLLQGITTFEEVFRVTQEEEM